LVIPFAVVSSVTCQVPLFAEPAVRSIADWAYVAAPGSRQNSATPAMPEVSLALTLNVTFLTAVGQ
jgi:hypothetical protein